MGNGINWRWPAPTAWRRLAPVPSMNDMKKYFAQIVIFAFCSRVWTVAADILEPKPSGHIWVIGNTLADRMQHSGWLESLLYARFPNHNLVFRNLSLSG